MRSNKLLIILSFGVCISILLACEKPVEATISSAERYIAERNYRAAVVELKSVLQRDESNARVRWLLGKVYLDLEDGASAEKELRWAGRLGVGEDAVIVALSQALLVQKRWQDVLALEPKGNLTTVSSGELAASRALALASRDEQVDATEAMKVALQVAPDSRWVRFSHARLLAIQGDSQKAAESAKALLDEFPEHGRTWSLLGKLYADEGKQDEAEAAFTRALEFRVRSPVDLYRRGLTRLALGNYEGLYADAALLKQWAPRSHQAGFLKGIAHHERKEFQQAADELEEAVSANAQHYGSVILLAVTHQVLGNEERSLAMAELAHRLRPNNVLPRKLLGTLYLEQRRAADVEPLLRPVVRQYPDDLQAKNILATSLMRQRKFQEAAELLADIAATRTDDPQSRVMAGAVLLGAGRRDEGLESLRLAHEMESEDPQVNRTIVKSLLFNRMSDEALSVAKANVESAEKDPVAWNLLAAAHAASGNASESLAAFKQALDLSPGDPIASGQLAILAIRRQDLVEARRLVQQALELNPEHARLRYLMAELHLHDGQVEQSVEALEQLVQETPGWLAPRLSLARLLLADGKAARVLDLLRESPQNHDGVSLVKAGALIQLQRYIEARSILEARRARLPNAPDTYFLLAKANAELGEAERLEQNLNRVLELEPNSIQAKLSMVRLKAVQKRFTEGKAILDGLDIVERDTTAVLDAELFLARKSGDSAKALALAQRLYAADPSSRNLIYLVDALVRSGRSDEALRRLEDAWSPASPDIAVGRYLSGLFIASNRSEDGIAVLHHLAGAYPNDVAVLNNLAWLLRDSDPKKGLGYAEQAYALAPQSPAVLDTFAELLVRDRQEERGLRIMDRAVEISGGHHQLRMRRAQLQMSTGKHLAAVEGLDELIQDHGAPEQTKQAARELLNQWGRPNETQ